MSEIRITGGKPVNGSVFIQGSKNAALPMMAAALLHRGVSVLKGCPKIADVSCMERILEALGAKTTWKGHDLYLDCTYAEKSQVPEEYTRQMRSSIIALGALVARNGRGCIGYPGGCVIGKRPIDLHLMVLEKLGAQIEERNGTIQAVCKNLKGTEIVFEKQSVGATEQAILSSVTATGTTCLRNCAREPEILWLCRYLQGMGAEITGEGSSVIWITGVKELTRGDMAVPPDRIVAGTYCCAAAITRGKVLLHNPPMGELEAFLEVYRKMGGQYEVKSGKLEVNGSEVCIPIPFLETDVYPGFPTDLQSPVMAVLATIPGESVIREKIFEDRFKAAEQLNRMGARIVVQERCAVIQGISRLDGCEVAAQELRGGAALVLAALAAHGETRVQGAEFILRGYEHICEDLTNLGVSAVLNVDHD